MIPDWIWPFIMIGCLLWLAHLDVRRIKRGAENYRAVEAERLAREATAPLGNVKRWP